MEQNRAKTRLYRNFRQIMSYLSGCIIFSIGAYLFIKSNLGADPLDVFSLGLRNHISITIGVAQAAVALVCILTVALLTKRRPIASPFFTFFFCGSLIDIALAVDVIGEHGAEPAGVMLAGALACAYGSALIIMSGFGIRAIDLLAITLAEKLMIPFWVNKGIIELFLATSGWLLGGPLGYGTLCFLIVVDFCIQPMIRANRYILRLGSYGFSTSDVT